MEFSLRLIVVTLVALIAVVLILILASSLAGNAGSGVANFFENLKKIIKP